ncbi:hypothetical protein Lfu02_03390 [Longispora fulva]|nr:hypothetical protein Lfu02_03390 [Longispora fulva]
MAQNGIEARRPEQLTEPLGIPQHDPHPRAYLRSLRAHGGGEVVQELGRGVQPGHQVTPTCQSEGLGALAASDVKDSPKRQIRQVNRELSCHQLLADNLTERAQTGPPPVLTRREPGTHVASPPVAVRTAAFADLAQIFDAILGQPRHHQTTWAEHFPTAAPARSTAVVTLAGGQGVSIVAIAGAPAPRQTTRSTERCSVSARMPVPVWR